MAKILMLAWILSSLAFPAAAQIPDGPQGTPVILEFDRKLCPICTENEAIIKAVQAMHPGQFAVRRLYIDQEEHLFRRYRVAIVPTQVFLDATGKEVFRHEGIFPKEKLIRKLRELKFIRE